MNDELMERLALAILNSDRIDGGWPPVGSRENIPDSDGYVRNVKAILSELSAAGFVIVPETPSDGLLISMAIRYDHGLGVSGYYDQQIFGASGCSHADRLESTVRTMRKLHEEVVGTGFYKPEREQEYAMLKARPV